MELLDDRPRVPKLPFFISDLVLLAVAAFLITTADAIPSTASIVGIVCCAGLGAALAIAPFIADYARNQELKLNQRQHALEAMARSTAAAVEQASIAANGLNEISETTKQNLRLIDELPDKIRAARESAEKKQKTKASNGTAELRAEIDKIRELIEAQAIAATKAMEVTQKELKEARKELKKIAATPVPTSPAPDSTPQAKPEPKPKKKPRAKKTPPPPAESSLFEDFAPEVNEDAVKAGEDEPESPQLPPIIEAVAWDEVAPSTEVIGDAEPIITSNLHKGAEIISDDSAKSAGNEEVESIPADLEPTLPNDEVVSDLAPELEPKLQPGPIESVAPEKELPEDVAANNALEEGNSGELLDAPAPEDAALSSDGMTRLTVTAYIGIGNRLFIRGDGPGLSSDEGTPLQFVSIGKWRWETDAATGPVKATLWKNDDEICSSLGEIEIGPGTQMETSANF